MKPMNANTHISAARGTLLATSTLCAVSSSVEPRSDKPEVVRSIRTPHTKVILPVPAPLRRWRSTDALTLKVGAWGESELQIPTAEFDSRSTCNVNPMCIHRQQRERQQRLQRQSGAVTARFTSRLLSA